MNVLAVLPQYVPWSRVGAWITTHDYLSGLAHRGHKVDVVCLYTREPDYEIDGVDVHPNGAEVPRPDLVVSHLGDEGRGARFADMFDVPSVRFVHGYHDDNPARLDQHRTSLAVFSSHALADATGWDGPQMVAHPPVFPERCRVKPGTHTTLVNLSVPKGGLLLGWIADAHPDITFLGVRGWGRQMEQQPANVEIVDPYVDARDVYRQTRVLLMPSEVESYGRCAVEAACSGIPTIAHPSPGLVEAMGDSAIWIDRRNRNDWIDTLRELQDQDRWYEASVRARLAVQKDPDATVDTVCDAIEELCLTRA